MAPQAPRITVAPPRPVSAPQRPEDGAVDPAVAQLAVAQSVMNKLIARGMPPVAAAAFTGNLQQESRFDPTSINPRGKEFGVVQWDPKIRKRALFSFAKAAGLDPRMLDTQLDFIIHELDTTERSARDAIYGATNVRDATVAASERYFRPGNPMMNNRIRNTQGLTLPGGGGSGAGPQTIGAQAAQLPGNPSAGGASPAGAGLGGGPNPDAGAASTGGSPTGGLGNASLFGAVIEQFMKSQSKDKPGGEAPDAGGLLEKLDDARPTTAIPAIPGAPAPASSTTVRRQPTPIVQQALDRFRSTFDPDALRDVPRRSMPMVMGLFGARR